MEPLIAWDYNVRTKQYTRTIGQCQVTIWRLALEQWAVTLHNGRRELSRSGFASFDELEAWVDATTALLNDLDRRQRER